MKLFFKQKENFLTLENKKFIEEQITKCDAVINFAAESFVDNDTSLMTSGAI